MKAVILLVSLLIAFPLRASAPTASVRLRHPIACIEWADAIYVVRVEEAYPQQVQGDEPNGAPEDPPWIVIVEQTLKGPHHETLDPPSSVVGWSLSPIGFRGMWFLREGELLGRHCASPADPWPGRRFSLRTAFGISRVIDPLVMLRERSGLEIALAYVPTVLAIEAEGRSAEALVRTLRSDDSAVRLAAHHLIVRVDDARVLSAVGPALLDLLERGVPEDARHGLSSEIAEAFDHVVTKTATAVEAGTLPAPDWGPRASRLLASYLTHREVDRQAQACRLLPLLGHSIECAHRLTPMERELIQQGRAGAIGPRHRPGSIPDVDQARVLQRRLGIADPADDD
jgi:hypothetical protein